MNLTGKIWKALVWSVVGYVVWRVIDHYAHVGGLPSADSLTNFLVFVGIGGAIYWMDENKQYVRHWLFYDQGRKLLIAACWILSLAVVFVRYGYPSWVPFDLPLPATFPMAVQIFAMMFLAYQGYLLVMWILF